MLRASVLHFFGYP